jgi:acyl-CoA hydrolase
MRRLLDIFRPGATIYLPGATGEIVALAEALAAEPDRMRGVTVVSCVLPGINSFDYAALADDAAMTVFLLPPPLRASFAAGRIRVLPLAYSGVAAWLRDCASNDLAIAHVAPPDADRRCSFGVAAEFSPIAWARARRRVAVINAAMPAMGRGPKISLADADVVIECESPLIELTTAQSSPAMTVIARSAAELIPDGAAVQVGVGSAPGAVCAALGMHRGLRMRSGIAPESVRALAEAGALAQPDQHQVGIAGGSRDYYRWLGDRDLLAFADTATTHHIGTLGALGGFHAVNGAIAVDLFGQVNLEWRDGRRVSGVGGAPDFVGAAAQSRGGRSIIALPATAQGGTVSRIVPRLTTPTVSLPAADADTVVTEHGVAELRCRALDDRATALIAVAGESFRDDLARAWRDMRQRW